MKTFYVALLLASMQTAAAQSSEKAPSKSDLSFEEAYIHPYEELKPKLKLNLFEEMAQVDEREIEREEDGFGYEKKVRGDGSY